MHRLTRIVAPALPVLSLSDAKAHLRVTHSEEDVAIAALVDAAAAWLDGWRGVLGMALDPQTWELALDYFPAGGFCIPLGPVVSIVSVKYMDAAGVEQTMPPADYEAHAERIRPVAGWPATNGALGAVRLQFVAGDGVPDNIKHVVRLLVGHWYENRESVGDKMESVPMAVDMLVNSIRVVRI